MTQKHRQPEVNIGLVGHVDHGKTTLVESLSGEWTDQHSEEMKRGISIRLGYADATFRECPELDEPDRYTVEETCPDGSESEHLRTVSFVDAPGHETLMATMLSGAAIMDGAVLVIAANEPVPRAQTEEHLMALDIIGIDNIVIAQNKIDLVDREQALDNYEAIEEFVDGTVAEDAPVVPISAQQDVNMDLLMQTIESEIPTPDRDPDADARLQVARSFDINRPGTTWEDLTGGVLGGSLTQGQLEADDDIEIKPGREIEEGGQSEYQPVETTVRSLQAGGEFVDTVTPGGLLGVGTGLDPSLTKGDALAGQVAGPPGSLPPTRESFTMDVELLDRVVGEDAEEIEPISTGEPLMLTVGTATTVGSVTSARDDECEVQLKRPVCAPDGSKIAINRRVGARWRLIGVGTLR
ncbi:translation initiation factor aIF-2 gamma subunit [Natronomonas pharaonis DSM 2160]|uniref:Translation initiation factor 2 subunit gamma n=1 Tax=Natronomonas pharaonis (strain ATCC 35678 / DSM 2160 / CIP 103997 / JCM 8858 / NBRC 14720 / NCIMB 2260 / Gabara) TaxID=348780 RepID=IF2G_NATPD|nr:translation initiation factor IF-2 subunit gamma [Natronomonas pharaonis]Q3IMM5.1 RecName: Full=Translation initiation factor 2 subunit gamma; AltName: Full=aIF2-gamma; AltName: Full=eIF-2-gamma [Natronomonas pharaonis DSM 2160]CAI50633.1 translation initiation factor aIF-2 gamma subunit [Natronomonas pharaonis DSM 2160]